MGKKATKCNSNKKAAFLAAFAESGTISQAARVVGIDRRCHYYWLENDLDYPEEYEEARSQSCEALEDEARRRAVEGWEEPVYQGGELVGSKRRYSDTMLAMLLNGNLPEKYGRNRHEHSGPGGGPIEVRSQVNKSINDLMNEPDYVEYLRHRVGNEDCDTRLACQIPEPGNHHALENGKASGPAGPGANGHRNGSQ